MTAKTRFKVYEFNRVMGSGEHLALAEIEFENTHNGFDTEIEAIDALLQDKRTMENFVILKTVYISY